MFGPLFVEKKQPIFCSKNKNIPLIIGVHDCGKNLQNKILT